MGFVNWVRDLAVKGGFYQDRDDYGDGAYDVLDDDAPDVDVTGYTARPAARDFSDRTEKSGKTVDSTYDRPRGSGSLPPLRAYEGGSRARGSEAGKLVDFNAARAQIVIASPKTIEDAGEICDRLLEGKIVALNFESADHAASQRIVDFLSGASYSLGGTISGMGNRTFIVAPKNVDISGKLKEELLDSDFLFTRKTAAR